MPARLNLFSGRARLWIVLLVLAVVALFWWMSLPNHIPPTFASLGRTNTAMRVHVGVGVLMVLPDGSLWRWGQPGGASASPTNAPRPERIGTDYDWVDAVAVNNHCLALKRDGTVWEWGWQSGSTAAFPWVRIPQQVGTESNWTAIAGGDLHSAALKRDGTLWVWGDGTTAALGTGVAGKFSQPVQVGTNTDWVKLKGAGANTYAIRRDGSLWAWGGMGAATVALPTQVCREMDWAEFLQGLNPWTVTRGGEVWQMFMVAPNATASRNSFGRLVATNIATGRVALASFALIELRPDGTLWQRSLPQNAYPVITNLGRPKRLGRRSDWVAISGTGTVVGLTADGTVWSWGQDLGGGSLPDFSSRITLAKVRIAKALGWPVNSYTTTGFYAVEKTPRPLMRLLVGETNAVSGKTGVRLP